MRGTETVEGLVDEMVQTRHAGGYRFRVPERVLRQFVCHCKQQGVQGPGFNGEDVDGFLYTRGLRASTLRRNERILHDFGEFVASRGHNAYICPVKTEARTRRHEPYVFTDDEIARLFKAIDGQPVSSFSNKALIDPALFRLLYGTGLRISEALRLTLADIDLEAKTLEVRDSKNGKDRTVPFTDALAATLAAYIAAAHPLDGIDERLFYSRDIRKQMDTTVIYLRFRDYLSDADIPHYIGGPCVHSFRHGLAVGCLKRWAFDGGDLTVRLPYLSAFMGHGDLRATQYYLRLTADLYPEVIERVQLRFGYVIPEVRDDE
jgi:integrase